MDAKSCDLIILLRPKSPSLTELSSSRKTVFVVDLVSKTAIKINENCGGAVLTVLRFQVSVQNSHCASRDLGCTVCVPLRQAQHLSSHLGRVDTVMASIQGQDELAEYAPDEALGRTLVLVLEILDNTAKVTITAVLHIQMQILAHLEMFSVVVCDDVGMAQVRQDLELGVELLALFLGHAEVGDLLAAHDEAIRSPAHLADDTEGAMT